MIPAEVIQIIGNLGIKGVNRVRARVRESNDREKIITRNVLGPIRVGDFIMLKETTMDTDANISQR